MAEIIQFPGKGSEYQKTIDERQRVVREFKRGLELITAGSAAFVLSTAVISACTNLSKPDYNAYAAGRLSGDIRSNGSDQILRRVRVHGSSEAIRQELEKVGGVNVRLEPTTESGVIGIAPQGTVFEEVVLINNWIGAKCDLGQMRVTIPLVDGKGEPINPEVCWMKSDYFKGKDLPK